MSSRKWWKKGPDSPERCRTNKESAAAEDAVAEAWRYLAIAGAPRCPKKDRAELIECARVSVDRARGHLASARYSYAELKGKVDRAEAARRGGRQKHTDSHDGSTYYYDPPGATAHEKAGVTSLRPVVGGLAHEVVRLGETLRAFRGGATRRPPSSAEDEVARRFRSFLFIEPPQDRLCSWCGAKEERHFYHTGLDGDGFPVKREEARRFCCWRCFADGKDLAEPAPKPLDVKPDPEHVAVAVEGPPALPPAPKLLTAGGAA